MPASQTDRIIAEVDRAVDEIVDFAARLVRIATVNPPGEEYEACANAIGDQLRAHGAEVQLLPAIGKVEHTPRHPRINVVGRHEGRVKGPAIHLNGHFDVVPAGQGWTRDPFGGEIVGDRLDGRGSSDMKAGLAAAVFAAEAIRRAGVAHAAPIEISGTVDGESGGFAGVAWLAENRWISLADRMIGEPTRTPEDAPVIAALTAAIGRVVGRPAAVVASPGTDDQKHVDRIGGVPQGVA